MMGIGEVIVIVVILVICARFVAHLATEGPSRDLEQSDRDVERAVDKLIEDRWK